MDQPINPNSGQVEIIGPYGRIYLYAHHTAEELIREVHQALSLKTRWNDPDYLAKLVFCRMVPLELWKEEGGFGIGTQLYADINLLVSLDTTRQVITIQSAQDKHQRYCESFQNFVTSFSGSAEI